MAARFPTALLAKTDVGGDVVNFGELQLDGAHSDAVTTLTCRTSIPAYWPTRGFVTVDSEIILYTGKSGSTLTGCSRAQESSNGGGSAAAHSDGATVGLYMTALQYNQLVEDLIAAQTKVGTGSDTAAANEVLRGTGAGTSDWGAVTEAHQTLADNTTNDVSTTKHGYVPKAPNDTAKFLRGDAAWAAPVVALTSSNSTITVDVNISSAQTWTDVTSLSLAAGTWLIYAQAVIAFGATTAHGIEIFNSTGSAHLSVQQTTNDATYPTSIVCVALVALAETSTIKLRAVAHSGTTSVVKATISSLTTDSAPGNVATQLTAIKIA